MKKVLSIVLSLVMVICMMPVMAFADTSNAAYPDIAGEPCEGAVNVLSALGVIDGYEDGTYRPDETITRAELTKIVITALGVADYASSTTSSYTDMANAQWAVPFVEYATNLNLVNGYGDGRFGPSDPITYEQAATLIVRAIGYTDDCNEMNGTWPAIYVQKATALGLFQNVTNGGATGATRGDTAVMLYNALTVPQVYADNDGQTLNKYGPDEQYLTMMDTLNANGSSEYKVVSSADADTAVNNISGYIGAGAEVIYNENDEVIALSDIKTTFLTGEYKSSNNRFEAEDGTTYTLGSNVYKVFADSNDGKITNAPTAGVDAFTNNANDGQKTFTADDNGKTFTIAATVSGRTITGIYSIAFWEVTEDDQVTSSDLNQIERNQRLLSKDFPLNDDQEIDTNAFILNGVDSLDAIEADNIVYVYTDEKGDDEITRIDVGTETVTGTISRMPSNKSSVTIDGTTYDVSSVKSDALSDVSAGDEVTLYLDYQGDVYATDTISGSAGNFAVVIAKSGDGPTDSAVGGTARVQLLTADGARVYDIDGSEYLDNDSLAWTDDPSTGLPEGRIVQYAVNDDGQITEMTAPDSEDYAIVEATANGKVTSGGYFDSHNISDSALIFTAPAEGNTFDYSDTDDLAVVEKADILNTDVALATYVYDVETNRIVCMVIDDSSTSEDLYGIVTDTYSIANNKSGADFYIGSELTTDGEVSGDTPTKIDANAALYQIKRTTNGSYSFGDVTAKKEYAVPAESETTGITVSNGYVQFTGDGTRYNLYDDAIVYVYNTTDEEYSIEDSGILEDDNVTSVKLYSTGESDDDSYGLINYIVVVVE